MRKLICTTLLGLALPGAALAGDAEAPSVTSWRAKRPDVPAPPTPVLPTFKKAVLDNGLTLLVTEVHALPVVSFNLVTRGGATYDPAGKAGLTSLTYDMLEEGAGALGALAFSDAVADLGADFGAGGGRQSGGVYISGLVRQAGPMLGLLADALQRPKLEAQAFERRKQQTIATLLRRRGSPQGLAFERIPEMIYGAGHPFGHPATGTVESVSGLTLDDVKAQYARAFSPKHSALIVAGDITLAQAKALAETHLGAWTAAKAEAPPAVPGLEAKPRAKVTLVDKPGAAQTMMIIGRPMFAQGHPDEDTVTLANLVFGGSFGARLNMNLREAKGYTYGAHSQASFRTGVGVFVAYSALRADVTGAGLAETFGELVRLKSAPPTAEELSDARSGVIRSMPGKFETSSAIAQATAGLFVYDLPLDHYAKQAARYEAVQLPAVQAKSLEYFVPELMQILLVGDAKLVRPQLDALAETIELGEIVVETP